MNSDRSLRTDRMGHRIEPLCPGTIGDPGGTAADNRLVVAAVLWHVRTGAPGRDLPTRFGKWNSVVKRFRRGATAGLVVRIVTAVPAAFDRESIGIDGTIVTAPARAAGAPSGARTLGGPKIRPSAAPAAA